MLLCRWAGIGSLPRLPWPQPVGFRVSPPVRELLWSFFCLPLKKMTELLPQAPISLVVEKHPHLTSFSLGPLTALRAWMGITNCRQNS